jgi:two-component system LytT family sensor kinase
MSSEVQAAAPAGRRAVWLVVVAFWLAFGVLESAKMVLSFRMRGEPIAWLTSLTYNLPWWLVWAALTPAVAAACRWLGPGARPPGLRLLGHLPAAAAVCGLHLVVISAQTHVTAPAGQVPRVGLVEHTWRMIDGYFMLDLLTYAGVVAAILAWHVHRRYHDERGAALSLALRASELEKHLVDAELSALRMELNPHFLFNALNSVAGLIRRGDGERAVDVLADLGDLLRATLDSSRRPEVALDEELALVERYLAIEGVRFADRLEVDIEVEPEVRRAAVPSMILQPLVENALRHGIARRPGPGRVLVSAARQGAALHLAVGDSGPGFVRPDPAVAGAGIGLRNTASRLRARYGDRANLAVGASPLGGAVVSITVPFEPAVVTP